MADAPSPDARAGGPATGSAAQMVVVGSINVDLTVRVDRRPVPGETVIGRSFTVSPGGKGANQAVAAARLGAAVAMVGAVGDDAYTAVALAGLEAAGVDLAPVDVAGPEPTGLALITVGGDGDNSIVVVPGANARLAAAAVARRGDVIRGASIVVVQGEIPADGVEQAAALASGRLIVNLAPVITLDPAVLRRADPLVVNEHEGAAALRLLRAGAAGADSTGAESSGAESSRAEAAGAEPGGGHLATERAIMTGLLDAGVTAVVLTCGAEGALVGQQTGAGEHQVTEIPAWPVPTVVDTTGAGDAFVGALARALVLGGPGDDGLVEAARYATRVAAFSVQAAGAQPSYPDQDTVLPGDGR